MPLVAMKRIHRYAACAVSCMLAKSCSTSEDVIVFLCY